MYILQLKPKPNFGKNHRFPRPNDNKLRFSTVDTQINQNISKSHHFSLCLQRPNDQHMKNPFSMKIIMFLTLKYEFVCRNEVKINFYRILLDPGGTLKNPDGTLKHHNSVAELLRTP